MPLVSLHPYTCLSAGWVVLTQLGLSALFEESILNISLLARVHKAMSETFQFCLSGDCCITTSAVIIFFTAEFPPVSPADATQPSGGKKLHLCLLCLWVSFLSSRNSAKLPVTSTFEWEGGRLGFFSCFCVNRACSSPGT